MKMLASLALYLIVFPFTAFPEAQVYILSGQSNMQGIGFIAELPEELQQPQEGVFFWNGRAFEPLVPGKTKISTREGEFGPELTFARTLRAADPAQPIYLIKSCASGRALHHGWNNQTWEGGAPGPNRQNFYPGETEDDPNLGVHYRQLRSMFRRALAHLDKNKVAYTVRGIVWMQGEQDSKNGVSATEYARSLRHFKQRLEEDLGVGEIPFVFGQVLPHEPAMARFTHRKELRRSQEQAHWSSGHPDAIPNVWMVPTEGMPLKEDTVHYNARGQAMLGEAFAKAMLKAQR